MALVACARWWCLDEHGALDARGLASPGRWRPAWLVAGCGGAGDGWWRRGRFEVTLADVCGGWTEDEEDAGEAVVGAAAVAVAWPSSSSAVSLRLRDIGGRDSELMGRLAGKWMVITIYYISITSLLRVFPRPFSNNPSRLRYSHFTSPPALNPSFQVPTPSTSSSYRIADLSDLPPSYPAHLLPRRDWSG